MEPTNNQLYDKFIEHLNACIKYPFAWKSNHFSDQKVKNPRNLRYRRVVPQKNTKQPYCIIEAEFDSLKTHEKNEETIFNTMETPRIYLSTLDNYVK